MTQQRFIKHSIWQLFKTMPLGDGHVPAGTKFRVEYPRRGDMGGIPIKFIDFDVQPLVGGKKTGEHGPEPRRWEQSCRAYEVKDYTTRNSRFKKCDIIMNEDKLRYHSRIVDAGANHEYLLYNKKYQSFWNGSYGYNPVAPRTFVSLENALTGVVKSVMWKKSKFSSNPEEWVIVRRGVMDGIVGEPVPLPHRWLKTIIELKKIIEDEVDDLIVKETLRSFANLLSQSNKDVINISMIKSTEPNDKRWIEDNLPNTQIYTKKPARRPAFNRQGFILLSFHDEEEYVLAQLHFIPRMASLLDMAVID